jgi:SPP1 family predicted phage head-tail adaptor
MNPGELKHRITLQLKQQARSPGGETVVGWVEFTKVWGKAWVDVGRENADVVRVDSVLTGAVVMRWRADVIPEMRLLWNGEQWEISAVADLDGRRRFLRLWIKRHV